MKKPGQTSRVLHSQCDELLVEEAELLLEARYATTTVNNRCLAASPSWVRFRINIEVHGVTSFTIGRAGHEFCSVSHHNGDGVIIGVDICFHNQ